MRRPSAAVIALIVFALVDVGVAWAAIRSTRADASDVSPRAVAAPTSASSGSSKSSARGTAHATTAASSAGQNANGGKVIVVALNSDRAWRAITTSKKCSTDAKTAVIGHTSDAGSNWTSVDVPMVTVSGLSYSAGKVVATGLDTSCHDVAYALSSSADPAKTSTAPAWAVSPTDSRTLDVSGQPVSEQPCANGVLDVAGSSSSDATVLCAHGVIRRSTDGGSSWNTRGTVKGAAAIGTASSGDDVYVVTRESCGLSVANLANSSGGKKACVPGTEGVKGPVDLSIVGTTLWLTSGSTTVAESVSQLG